MDERRRYFRIEDTIGIHYELLTPEQVLERQQAISLGEYAANNELQEAERQLQLVIDKLKVQNPEVSLAIELLNTKFNLLKTDAIDSPKLPKKVRASISACGVNFDTQEPLTPQDHVILDITLLPTDLHVQTIAQVVNCQEVELDGQSERQRWAISFDFIDLHHDMEELLVQHLVKRQGRLIARERQKQS